MGLLLARSFSFLRHSALLLSVSSAPASTLMKPPIGLFRHLRITSSSLYHVCNSSLDTCLLPSNIGLITNVNHVLYCLTIIKLRAHSVGIVPEMTPQISILVFLKTGIEEVEIPFCPSTCRPKIDRRSVLAPSSCRWMAFMLFCHPECYGEQWGIWGALPSSSKPTRL